MHEQLKEVPAQGLTTTDKLRMLLDITKKISRSLDLQEVLNLVMGTLDSLIPYDAAGIFILKCDQAAVARGEEPCVFEAEAVRGYDIDELSELHLKLGEGIIGHVALTSEANHLSRRSQRSSLYQRSRRNTLGDGSSDHFK